MRVERVLKTRSRIIWPEVVNQQRTKQPVRSLTPAQLLPSSSPDTDPTPIPDNPTTYPIPLYDLTQPDPIFLFLTAQFIPNPIQPQPSTTHISPLPPTTPRSPHPTPHLTSLLPPWNRHPSHGHTSSGWRPRCHGHTSSSRFHSYFLPLGATFTSHTHYTLSLSEMTRIGRRFRCTYSAMKDAVRCIYTLVLQHASYDRDYPATFLTLQPRSYSEDTLLPTSNIAGNPRASRQAT
ncbi:hypothetical protein Pcinc_005425 [Petrolisthes cinctipes]|uniref:Uncharacterized protein n=1 Tax=Petrolisthes cinctipes TaxID=88211 RepID=A0AAE1GF65_PETCI|nr:hypothetical protein Pcinc_005425 [Petrolisthes cinctipes]